MGKLTIPEVLKEKNGRVLWTKESLGFTPVQKVQKLFDDNGVKGRVSGVESRKSGGRFHSFVIYECLRCGNLCKQIVLSLINGRTCKYCSRLKVAELRKGKAQAPAIKIETPEEAQTFLDTYANGKFKFLRFERNKWSNLLIVAACEVCGIENCKTVKDWKSGIRCANCSRISKTFTKEQFVEAANKVHNGMYSYDNFDYTNNRTKSWITCRVPGHGVFEQTPDTHINMKTGCPKCKNSKGETFLDSFLTNEGYKIVPQCRFKGCKHKSYLPFDFYLPDLGVAIEFQGSQHYDEEHYFHKIAGEDSFEKQQLRDKIKVDFCKEKGIFLIPIDANKVTKNEKLDTEFIEERLGKFLREIDEYERTSEEWRKLEYY